MDGKQFRFCKAIACARLKGFECEIEECEHPDKAKALEERRKVLKAVRNG